jgi:hypothetical protein
MLALLVCTWGLKINNNLRGLTASNLLVLCATSALFSVFPHNLAYYYFGYVVNISDGIGPMFVGDFLGMLIVLYFARLTLKKKLNCMIRHFLNQGPHFISSLRSESLCRFMPKRSLNNCLVTFLL